MSIENSECVVYENMKNDRNEFRHCADGKVEASLLSVLISEIEKKSKEKNSKGVNDAMVIAVLKTSLKNANVTLDALKNAGRDVDDCLREIKLIENYLPSMLSDAELREKVVKIIQDGANNMGMVMGALKSDTSLTGRYEGKTASRIVKEELV